ncbi:MAG: carboxylating nicotinate-nucleotide diphosphorylase [Candidatus Gastranaerophilales bacterium]|nr:carboxylating nicotinate-nucleotide diphosphorylase [Candidatus Gastranaerophilales bacterium]
MPKYLLHNFIIDNHIKTALEEDIGFGDISTDYLISDDDQITSYLNTREDGILCGMDIVKRTFKTLSRRVVIESYFEDGDKIKKGDTLAKISGPARFILTGERTALNYVQRLSGIATETNKYQEAIKPYAAGITDTRKTTPGFRLFEKYAVKVGGAKLHRFNLSDCVMLKDNHIKFAGSIKAAVQKVRENISHAHKIEVECDTLEQVKEALKAKADIIMFDNMTIDEMKEGVELVGKKAMTEASGNVKLDTVNEIASTGVNVISSSAIVAKAFPLDIGLDM